jgi:hypothetical protein
MGQTPNALRAKGVEKEEEVVLVFWVVTPGSDVDGIFIAVRPQISCLL